MQNYKKIKKFNFSYDKKKSFENNQIDIFHKIQKQDSFINLVLTKEPLFNYSISYHIFEHLDNITGFSINGYGEIIISYRSKIKKEETLTFNTEQLKIYYTHIQHIISKITEDKNQVFNFNIPYISHMISFFILDKNKTSLQIITSRIAISTPPLSEKNVINVRFPPIDFRLDDYIKKGFLNNNQVFAIKECIKYKKNILIIGGTHSGKTTFLNSCLHEILSHNSLTTLLEDTPEIFIEHSFLNKRVINENTLHPDKVLKHLLREDLERICVGEVRDGLIFSVLKAWKTGHEGGVCTIHANGIEDMYDRIREMCYESQQYNSNINLSNEILQRLVPLVIHISTAGRNKRSYNIYMHDEEKSKMILV